MPSALTIQVLSGSLFDDIGVGLLSLRGRRISSSAHYFRWTVVAPPALPDGRVLRRLVGTAFFRFFPCLAGILAHHVRHRSLRFDINRSEVGSSASPRCPTRYAKEHTEMDKISVRFFPGFTASRDRRQQRLSLRFRAGAASGLRRMGQARRWGRTAQSSAGEGLDRVRAALKTEWMDPQIVFVRVEFIHAARPPGGGLVPSRIASGSRKSP
jgi:hypothetical protein